MEQKTEQSPIDREIHELSREVREKNYPETGREAIRRVIGEKLRPPQGIQPTGPQSQVVQPIRPGAQSSLPAYADALPQEAKAKAEQLLSLAFQEGIMKAIKEVRNADPLTMDIFHDAITTRLHQEFIRRGLMK